MSRGRLVWVLVGALALMSAWVTFSTVRESRDDPAELAREVESQVTGTLVEGWTLTEPSCPDFAAASPGAEIDCAALATDERGRQRTANVRVRIARCHGNLPAQLLGQDDTRDCSYDHVYTIQPGPGRGDGP